MIIKFLDYIKENIKLFDNDGILIIVDVQKAFESHITKGFDFKLKEYCNKFKSVYQIWDATEATRPTFKFPNEKIRIKKRYGIKRYYKKFNGAWYADL